MVDVVRPGDRLARTLVCSARLRLAHCYLFLTGYLKSYETFKRRFEIPIVNGMLVCGYLSSRQPTLMLACEQVSARTRRGTRCAMHGAVHTC